MGMSRNTLVLLLLGWGGLFLSIVHADPGRLEKTAEGLKHLDSASFLPLSADWKVIAIRSLGQHSIMAELRHEKLATVTTVYWSLLRPEDDFRELIRLNATEKDGYGNEHNLLRSVYGTDVVAPPEAARIGPLSGVRVRLDSGPSRDRNLAGVVYLTELRQGDRRWKFKIRQTSPQDHRSEAEAALEMLLKGFTHQEKSPPTSP